MFDVTSTLGTSLVVAVPASVVARAEPGGAKALRDAVAAEQARLRRVVVDRTTLEDLFTEAPA